VSPYSGDAYVALHASEVRRMTLAQLPVILQRQGGEPPEFVPRLGTKWDAHAIKVCVAFEGDARSTCSCGIYESRPDTCRQFEAGSVACREARRLVGVSA
jgi:Fe-S-cluster containining protein